MSDCLDSVKLSDFGNYPNVEYTVTREKSFYKECPSGYVGDEYVHKKTYVSNISIEHAGYLESQDSDNFDAAGQALANSNGSCVLDKPNILNPILSLQAVDEDYFWINGMEPFTRTEFDSADPLPLKPLRNKNISSDSLSVYPHNNTDKLVRVANPIEGGEYTRKVRFTTYDSSIHGYSSDLDHQELNMSMSSAYNLGFNNSATIFDNGALLVNAIIDKVESRDTIAEIASTGVMVGGVGLIVYAGGSYFLWVTLGLGPLGWGFAWLGVVMLAVFKLWKKHAQPFIQWSWRDGDTDGLSSFMTFAVPPPIQYDTDPTNVLTIYDDIDNKAYTAISARQRKKRSNSSVCIVSIGFPGGRPDKSTFSVSRFWEYDSEESAACIAINTTSKMGFLWDRGGRGNSFGKHIIRGGDVSIPANHIIDRDVLKNGVLARTIKDSSSPNRCYIWLYGSGYNRVVEYNSTADAWRVVRKSDDL